MMKTKGNTLFLMAAVLLAINMVAINYKDLFDNPDEKAAQALQSTCRGFSLNPADFSQAGDSELNLHLFGTSDRRYKFRNKDQSIELQIILYSDGNVHTMPIDLSTGGPLPLSALPASAESFSKKLQ